MRLRRPTFRLRRLADRGRPLFRPLRERNQVAVGVVGLMVLVLLSLVAYNADALPLIGGGTTYSADFTEAAGLKNGNEVRVAGVKVGKVTHVGLDGDQVKVTFRVRHTWIGNASTAAIGIKTLLGEKYLALDPLGDRTQDPGATIPKSRTTSPYDVTQAFNGLGQTFGAIDTDQLAASFQAISDTFKDTPASVRSAATGLSSLSRTISSRDAQLASLLSGSKQLTKTLSDQNGRFQQLISDGNLLLGEVEKRRTAIHSLLTGTESLGTQLNGLVSDNDKQLGPTLDALDRVTNLLLANQSSLDKVLALAGPYYQVIGNTLGNGRWFDSYLCGLVPANYLPSGSLPSTGCMPPKATGGAS
ncbi:phospholipid/cholesterol/gamma-HCH transport system substrate-binding protein [Actinacidiphila yanglinensis]|uniref:Phospholipid/cholesterol/gamma-HCH transport system substrate-binding protein n=1 Tax=Actinacidiphila yanglinensis TaxID=310779 RepID=A0A1H5T4L6_9ACTN|nr:MCE family protein [Actinacidiphila yanglinensis]SEF57753.1 phospholipid/cholesterol/gamma-HCH transport system substrate-binding protein [Actinacidiphila yanglinensis]